MQVRVSLWSRPKARIRCPYGQRLGRYSGKPEPMRLVTCAVHSWLSRRRMLRPMPVSSQMLKVSTFSAMQSMTFRTAVAMRPQWYVGGRCRLPFLPRGTAQPWRRDCEQNWGNSSASSMVRGFNSWEKPAGLFFRTRQSAMRTGGTYSTSRLVQRHSKHIGLHTKGLALLKIACAAQKAHANPPETENLQEPANRIVLIVPCPGFLPQSAHREMAWRVRYAAIRALFDTTAHLGSILSTQLRRE